MAGRGHDDDAGPRSPAPLIPSPRATEPLAHVTATLAAKQLPPRPVTLVMAVEEIHDDLVTLKTLRQWVREGALTPIGKARVKAGRPYLTYDMAVVWSVYGVMVEDPARRVGKD